MLAARGTSLLTSVAQRRGLTFLRASPALLRAPAAKVGSQAVVRGAEPFGNSRQAPAALLHRPITPCNDLHASLQASPRPTTAASGAPRIAAMSAVAPAAAAPAAPAGGDEKLARMRAAMAQADGGRGVHAFIVPSEDPHMVGGWVRRTLPATAAAGRLWRHGGSCQLCAARPWLLVRGCLLLAVAAAAVTYYLPGIFRHSLTKLQSEYPPECDARRAYISGFDGSAGTAVVCTDAALLWTDGRYFLQARRCTAFALRGDGRRLERVEGNVSGALPRGGAQQLQAEPRGREGVAEDCIGGAHPPFVLLYELFALICLPAGWGAAGLGVDADAARHAHVPRGAPGTLWFVRRGRAGLRGRDALTLLRGVDNSTR